ncbi:MAG: KpsF/GutQ family sugar-phosphate isomerase [Alphaproteobacteria bacterium]|jgi:arabinose-5-phosphate isomerase|nr:KpsF/GutQ family sugar-phosphate isomerase [Alphaproteobacteria bacterium]NDA17955.1 KpsF/GutQ family sugar-phosphate isomerase [Alphaproteobacteria bacterium]NDG36231.1 KpsF/GutQ family sugar-phosphate isomerase [Alphaproteobacteria bacterium]
MTNKVIASAKTLFSAYREALTGLEAGLGDAFSKTVDLMQASTGHVVVCGMGKSGIIGRKISATLASTGTPSLFLHPAEAIHGDLGMVRRGDIVLLISYSGTTEEIVRLLPAFQRLEARLIAMTGNADSIIATSAEISLDISVNREACPLNLAPTTSSLNSLVLGDAIAVALMEARGFQESDFANTHPGGALGRRLLTRVRDKMRAQNLPFVDAEASVQDALLVMTEGRLGLALVGSAQKLAGVITDGDLRRLLVGGADLATTKVCDVASPLPLTISPDEMMGTAEARMLEARVQCLVVVGEAGHVEGVIQIYE